MRFSLLGSSEIWGTTRTVRPPSPKPRQVLAMLLMRAEVVTPIEHLSEELWGSAPPRTGVGTLQAYIHHLRRGLAARRDGAPAKQPACELITQAGGYLLRLGPADSLDVHEFRESASRGRAQLVAGEVAAAASSLREGLELWRGEVFSGVRLGPHLHIQAARLAEERRTALGNRIDADLRLGRHTDLIAELTALVCADRTDEALSLKLMRALSASGRRTDALAEYERVRSVLATDLGVRPSAAIERLRADILSPGPADGPALPTVRTAGQAARTAVREGARR